MDPLPQPVQPDSNPNAAPPPFIEDKQEIEIVPVQEGDDDFENVGDGDDEDDEFDDSESLLMDIVNEEIDDVFEIPDAIPKDEALQLRIKLRQKGPNTFIYDHLTSGQYTARRLLTAFDVKPPEFFASRPDDGYWRLLGLALLKDLSIRHKLPEYNTLDDAAALLRSRQNIMVITGAGISTNLGVPDFRSKNTGFYDQMREKGFDSPEDIFDIFRFKEDPSIFYSNSSPTLPQPDKSTPTHAFIRLIESKGKLLTNYTQNIDNVEGNVGISKDKIIQAHGSWATFTCTKCNFKADGRQYYEDVRAKRVARCKMCPTFQRPQTLKRKRSSKQGSRSTSRHWESDDDDDDDGAFDIPEPGVMKPDITFFGEKLPDAFFDRFQKHDINRVDLIIVIGTSMSVGPVSEIPMAVAPDIPQIYISREPLKHIDFDVTMLGDCDLITAELAKRAGWYHDHPMLKEGEVELFEQDHDLAIWRVNRKGDVTSSATAPPLREKPEESPEPQRQL